MLRVRAAAAARMVAGAAPTKSGRCFPEWDLIPGYCEVAGAAGAVAGAAGAAGVAGLVVSVEGAGVAGVAGVALVEGVLLVEGAAALSAGPGVAGAVTAGVLLTST